MTATKEQEFCSLIQKLNYDLGGQCCFALEGCRDDILPPVTAYTIRQAIILAKLADDEYAVAKAFARFYVELAGLADQNILDTAERNPSLRSANCADE
jgi:hypothetical protein